MLDTLGVFPHQRGQIIGVYFFESEDGVGDKLFGTQIIEGSTSIYMLYHWRNTGQELFRCLLWPQATAYPAFPA